MLVGRALDFVDCAAPRRRPGYCDDDAILRNQLGGRLLKRQLGDSSADACYVCIADFLSPEPWNGRVLVVSEVLLVRRRSRADLRAAICEP